jgi:hypothetical protein
MEVENKNTAGTERKLSNLIPFTKGFDPRRNLEGRPQGSVSIVESLKRKLSEIEPESKRTYLDLFMETYLRKTIKGGDSKLIVDYINRVDGMPKQKIEQDGTLEVKWSNDNNNTLHATTTPEATPRIED